MTHPCAPGLTVLAAVRIAVIAVAASGLAAWSTMATAAVDSPRLQPHRAIYDLTLSRSASGSGLNEMNGRLVYELRGAACEGYTQTMRFVTRSTTSDGSQQTNDIRVSSFEEATGDRLDFSTTHHHDNQTQVTEGQAARKDGDARGGVKVNLRRPETRELSLPSTVYFPIQHSLAMLAAARRGERRFVADLYDGSEKGDKISATATIIGEAGVAKADDLTAGVAAQMVGKPYWPIATSYFERTKTFGREDTVPNYEMSARFFENGVSTRLVLDYGDFALSGDIKDLTFLPDAPCVTEKK